jgi:hypothetical protein
MHARLFGAAERVRQETRLQDLPSGGYCTKHHIRARDDGHGTEQMACRHRSRENDGGRGAHVT